MAITITSNEKQILQSVTIPPRPEALLKVSEEAKKPEPDLAMIARIISSDISISAAVLQVVNSAAFRRMKEIESIQQAVMTLGQKRVLPLTKSVALKSAMGQSDKLASFWEEASTVAASASIISRLINKLALVDNAYMLGLFHNAGIPIMMLKYDDFDAILQVAKESG
ncbi:HDOD domain-containing protein [Alteromonas sediminis]|uniref:HDOD domain-containing protein n=1 Tax=Alteromonas sediminis TaxID=2259342 RepID=UPI001F0C99B1|nr:HDOD domain-containing protein [Alteromonas sediminis]